MNKRLPPNQVVTSKFPVVGERHPGQEIDLDHWRLIVANRDGAAIREISWQDVQSIPQQNLQVDIHCVTGWSRFDTVFTGLPLATLLREFSVSIPAETNFVRFTAYSARKHDVSLPLEVALEDSWLVHSADGEPLSISRGYPLRVLTPSRYLYKSLKWVHRIEFTQTEHPGFWERASGYHNNADPWLEQRLDAHRFSSQAEIDEFRELEDFSKYRDPDNPIVIVKGNFNDWLPNTRDLRGLQLKASSFRGADLSRCNLTATNLTLSKFAGANLEGADLSNADLEGVDFSGAKLAGAILDSNYLSAAVFTHGDRGLVTHKGLRVLNPDGLIESQRQYLAEIGCLID